MCVSKGECRAAVFIRIILYARQTQTQNGSRLKNASSVQMYPKAYRTKRQMVFLVYLNLL